MNSWNFNELTQEDVLDYKACQRKDGSIYGVPDKSDCQKGKEISKEEIQALALKSNKGDKAASDKLKKISEVNKEQERTQKKEAAKKKAEEEKKKKEAEGKKGKGKGKKGGGKKGGGKKGGGGKGKSGGKGKGGGAKGGGKSKDVSAEVKQRQRQAQANRQDRQRAMRKRLQDLQSSLRKVKNPEVKKALEQAISDLMKGVAELSKTAPSTGQETNKTPAAPTGEVAKPEKKEEG